MSSAAASSLEANGPRVRRQLVPNSVLGTIVFILTEMMFFGALISAFMIVKAGNVMWPPPGQPRLPIELTAINTLFLVASAVTIYLSNKSLNAGNEAKSIKQLGLTIILGGTFLAIQGFEWIRMLSFGLTFTSSNYGSFFYMIIGSHGLHVVGGMLVLINVFLKFAKGNLLKSRFWGAQTFWYFVVGVWPVLYVLVYLS